MKIIIILSFILFSSQLLAKIIHGHETLKLSFSDGENMGNDSIELGFYDYILDFNDKKSKVEVKLLKKEHELILKSKKFLNGNFNINLGAHKLSHLKLREPLRSGVFQVRFPDIESYQNFKKDYAPKS